MTEEAVLALPCDVQLQMGEPCAAQCRCREQRRCCTGWTTCAARRRS